MSGLKGSYIVLCGGIGAGKSIVARTLRLWGFGVFDCDSEAKTLMAKDSRLADELKEIASENIYSLDDKGDRILNRNLLASLIFNNSDIRGRVNEIVHKAVRKRIHEWMEDADKNRFVETAIAVESGIAEKAVEIWMVNASLNSRCQRVEARDGRQREEILRIMDSQKAEEAALKRLGIPFFEIDNDDGDSLLPQLKNLISHL